MRLTPFSTDRELNELFEAFAECTLPRISWTHREHLAVACVAAKRYGTNSVDWIRRAIPKLNASQGVVDSPTSGYHETLTIAWMRLFSELINRRPELSELELVNESLRIFSDKRALLTFYSKERLMSPEARATWLEPDLVPLGLDQLEVGHDA